MKALLIDSWLSSSCCLHHRLCPLSLRVSSLHHDASFIKNVIVTLHFCFTLIFKIWHNNPFQNPLCLLLTYLPIWSLVPTWSHMSDHVFTCDFFWQLALKYIQMVCLIHLCLLIQPQPPSGLQSWEQSGRLGNNWWRIEWTNEKCTTVYPVTTFISSLFPAFSSRLQRETAPNQVGRVRPCLKKTLILGGYILKRVTELGVSIHKKQKLSVNGLLSKEQPVPNRGTDWIVQWKSIWASCGNAEPVRTELHHQEHAQGEETFLSSGTVHCKWSLSLMKDCRAPASLRSSCLFLRLLTVEGCVALACSWFHCVISKLDLLGIVWLISYFFLYFLPHPGLFLTLLPAFLVCSIHIFVFCHKYILWFYVGMYL